MKPEENQKQSADGHLRVNREHNLERNLLGAITKAMTNPRLHVWLNCVNEAFSYASRKLYPKEYW